MKTGRIGKLTVSISVVILALIILKLNFIDTKDTKEQKLGALIKNKQNLSLIPDFASIPLVSDKKQAFFDYLRPWVRLQNGIINDERQFLQRSLQHINDGLVLTEAEYFRIEEISNKYQYSPRTINAETIQKLLIRADIIPESMVLIQAANETGWGSSRFAREGLNFFGQWCFKKGCGLVPQSRTSGMSHEVAVFKSVEDSVASYMRNLNSNAAYSLLRSIRADMRAQNKEPTANELVYGLVNYSERQEAYIDELLEMLRHNQQYLVGNNEEKTSV
ncbi:glucosaminidase domain-containing protein [Shewanella sp. D64]|uniref:glucosaminidase domain-containing protein n=1 Tax=unclassified Shewanella TaxID=196818 RepID=UPI0022BA2AD8|nr:MULTISPECIES: glucosaminidase domain-containing protein [unclassified Shewanella]MEC4724026.1 glucosaminidase domain-containing protein [Shewanella sp. D64]MEC4736046.1 glucosaminidase domain-containing protein [Shewanella sp. E94]WBJ98009.1 glucosaminidase domain-containing protein [Shewanella sp. MTB7]